MGPTTAPTASALAYDANGNPCSWWDCGLPKGKVTPCPSFTVEIPLKGGGTARASIPSTKSYVLVNDLDRERVTLHWALATKTARLGTKRQVVCGVHVFVEERSDGFVGVTVIPNAGTLDPAKPATWPGAFSFSQIRFILPSGWMMLGASFGQAGDWYFGPRCWTSRRISLVGPGGSQVNAARWVNQVDLQVNGHKSLGPARYKIPQLLAGRHQHMSTGTGAGPIYTDRSYTGGDMVSGYGIVPLGGWEGSTQAAQSYEDDVWRVLSGHPCAAFHAATGNPILPHEWTNVKGYPLTNSYLRFDPWNAAGLAGSLVGTFGWRTDAAGPKEFNPGPCANRSAILAIQKHDGAHLIRALHVLTAAWWYTRSWAAWLALRMIGADVVTSQVLNGSNQYLREQGWTRKALATTVAILPPGAERDFYMNQRDQALVRLSQTIMPNGWSRAGSFPNSDNGEPWSMGMSTEYATAAAWQLAFYVDGLHDLLCVGPLKTITKQRADWLLTGAVGQLIDGPLNVMGSPPVHVGVIRSGQVELPPKTGIGRAHDGHFIHEFHALAVSGRWTGDPKYAAMLTKVGWPQRTLPQLQAFWGSPQDQQPEWTALCRTMF